MAGKPKQKIYQYTEEGKFVKSYSSQTEVKIKYFNNPQYPLFVNIDYEIINFDYFFKEKVGRNYVKKLHKMLNSIYVPKKKLNKVQPFQVFNLKGDLLATFESDFAFAVLCGLSLSTANAQIKKEDQKTPHGELIFKKVV